MPGVLKPPAEGWHDTGDIVTIDEGGFVTIRGRAKRFAKIGGEMVSLPAVEGYARRSGPGRSMRWSPGRMRRRASSWCCSPPAPDAKTAALQAWGKANGVAEIAMPREIRIVEALPVLGTGKLDYVTMTAMAAG